MFFFIYVTWFVLISEFILFSEGAAESIEDKADQVVDVLKDRYGSHEMKEERVILLTTLLANDSDRNAAMPHLQRAWPAMGEIDRRFFDRRFFFSFFRRLGMRNVGPALNCNLHLLELDSNIF